MKVIKFLNGLIKSLFVDARFDCECCRPVNCKEGTLEFYHEFRHVIQSKKIPLIRSFFQHFYLISFCVSVVSIAVNSPDPIFLLICFQVGIELDAILYSFEEYAKKKCA